jgi:hypothetical protein
LPAANKEFNSILKISVGRKCIPSGILLTGVMSPGEGHRPMHGMPMPHPVASSCYPKGQ